MDDPFARLGLSRRFDLDRAEVESAYLARAAEIHPDAASDPEATQRTALLNAARETLADPERRARALLALHGVPEGDDLPDGLLMEMMEIRMEIESDLVEGGSEALERWRAWGAERRAERLDRIAEMFADGSDPERLAGVRTELNALRYVERLIEQLG